MESTEEVQKYMAVAQSLSKDARNDDSALQSMKMLLASNCQKLCIGPSFHFYTDEKAENLTEQSKETEESAVEEMSDDDDYETVIYKGPDVPYEIVEGVESNKSVLPKSGMEAMQLKLAKVSAECGGLLSPNFFLQSLSPVNSCRTSNSTDKSRCPTTPFTFPTANNHETTAVETITMGDVNVQKLERIELLDDAANSNESEWVEWPKKFIESKGFCLGIQPGNFYKEESRSHFYVKLPHRCPYEILVTNNNQLPCDLDLYVDGQLSNVLRIPAGASRCIDGPQYSKHAFKFFLAQEPPPGKKVREGDRKNGLVKAVFVPCKVGSARPRAATEPPSTRDLKDDILDLSGEDTKDVKKRAFTFNSDDQNTVERSLDMSRVAEGITLLQGKKKKRQYMIAPEMETDPSKKVILQLRLIASLDEEIAATEAAVYDLEPPLLPKKK